MPRYQYRMIEVWTYDKHAENPGKRRGGENADRQLIVSDTGEPEVFHFRDAKGDNLSDFRRRVLNSFVRHLNALGAEGWQVASAPNTASNYDRAFANGCYLLMRTEEPSAPILEQP